MNPFARTNDLQQAIDTVANGDGAADSGMAQAGAMQDGATQDNVAQFGIPPMPPMPENGGELPKVEPLVPVENPATAPSAEPSAEEILSQSITSGDMPPATEPVAPAASVAEAVPPVETASDAAPADSDSADLVSADATPVSTEAVPAEDLSDVKQNILKDLLPILDKTEKTAEEKFEIYKDAISTMHDVKTIEGAYKTATQIGDEARRAEALFDVMKIIDNQ